MHQIGHSFKIVGEGKFKIKFTLMKSPLLLFTLQEILFEVDIRYKNKTDFNNTNKLTQSFAAKIRTTISEKFVTFF